MIQEQIPVPRLALVTPARNEASFLRETIESVVAQTVHPVRWVIVSDGSTDGTDEIVREYAELHEWIELVRLPERKERHFGGKVNAFYAGYAKLKDVEFEVIGNLDADITFDSEYFSFLLQKFQGNSKLGVAGTPFVEDNRHYDFRFTSIEHVSGACQLFRKQCFEDIGGYKPIKTGGVDLVAVISARMKGWQTRSFLEKLCFHQRKMSSANHSTLGIAFASGRTDYTQGCDPVWEFFRSIYQMTRPPVLLGGVFTLAGYILAVLKREERVVTTEFVHFRKIEQRRRLRDFFKNLLQLGFLNISKRHS
jgi:glycosyltransferase involved in cell wall biosynthesis